MAADGAGGPVNPQTWLDLIRVWAPGVSPAAVIAAWVGFVKWRAARRDKSDEGRANRATAEAAADAMERRRLDEADAAQLARHTAEIARKDAEIVAHRVQCAADMAALRAEKDAAMARKDIEIVALKLDRDDGWRGAVAAGDGWRQCRHDAQAIIGRLCLKLEVNHVVFDDPPKLASVPDLDTLTGRKGRTAA